ncbi:ribonuclease H-like protein [Lentinus brumalis]|uniref:ribonuclease H n=1 Tax=Lentinus brumalis TaxID=2498619 RepID=A0A371DVY0_9APHY|nr:ribonuclease H-like protein [Polyporus brumalis]
MPDAAAGSGVWFGPDHQHNISARVPGETQSNQAAEVYAVTLAAGAVPKHTPLHVVTDSKYTLDGLTVNLPQWEDCGWLGVANAALFQEAVAWLRSRTAVTTLRWVKGHDGVPGNEGADALAKRGAGMPDVVGVEALPPSLRKFLPIGAKLAALTQAKAYRWILNLKDKGRCVTSERNALRVVAAVSEDLHCPISENRLWRAFRSKDLGRKIRIFLWKSVHDAYRVGQYWRNIPQCEHRATCDACGVEESMEHILTECDAPGQRIIWQLAWTMLERAGLKLPDVSYGLILGAPASSLNENFTTNPSAGTNRLYRIVLTESAYLIWTLRCERVIQLENDPERWRPPKAVARAWLACIRKRMNVDWMLTRVKTSSRKSMIDIRSRGPVKT